ncbi:hypothetical protein Tco_0949780 [Tanacetum coccineum]
MLATRVPAHLASAHPHQYVTLLTPHTGVVLKHLTGHGINEESDGGHTLDDDDGSCKKSGLDRTQVVMMMMMMMMITVILEKRM